MGHIADVRHYGSNEEVYSSEHYERVLDWLEIFAADSLLFRPGTDYSYSSFGGTSIMPSVKRPPSSRESSSINKQRPRSDQACSSILS